jgi:uncharacterized coiled-coil DUF342 family protein
METKHKSENDVVYSFKDLRKLTEDITKYNQLLHKQYDEQVEAYEKQRDILDTITQAKSEKEDSEGKVETLQTEVNELRELLESKGDDLPTNLAYLQKDYNNLLDDYHFQDELEALIRKYKGY